MHGLDIALICFHCLISKFLKTIGFSLNKREPCRYTKRKENNITIILVFVDDFIITGNNETYAHETIQLLSAKYERKNLGFPSMFVGLQIEKRTNAIFLHQTKYVQAVVRQYYEAAGSNLQTTKWALIPMLAFSEHSRMQLLMRNKYPYRQVLGALIYLANYSRPDLSF